MKQKLLITAAVLALVFTWGANLALATTRDDVPRISKEELKEKMGNPDVVIYDVRTPDNYKKGVWKIKGAIRQLPDEVDKWAADLDKDKTYVLYCLRAQEDTSATVGAKMIDMGFKHVFALKGGLFPWLKARYPMEKK